VDLYQERAIKARERTIRIVAPAGSGKTQTILNRVLNRLSEGISPEHLIILTFDKSAVRSIRSKLWEWAENSRSNLRALRIQTLNAFGYEVLRSDFPHEYQPVITEPHRRLLFRDIKRSLNERSPNRFSALPFHLTDNFYLEFFSLLKNELFDPRDLQPQTFADFMLASPQAKPLFEAGGETASVRSVIEAVGWMFKAYERALQWEQLIDFDDQKLRAYFALKNPEVRKRLQKRYREVIVDEFQDINRLDFALINLLAEKSNLIITGDDDQSIYGFRNCSADFMIDLEKHLGRKVASYELKINYRNPANLIEHAAKLISHNVRRIPKGPISGSSRRARIEIVSTPSAGSEARLVASAIQEIKHTNPGTGYRDFAILFRINAQSLPLQIELALNDIPYQVHEPDHILRNEAIELLLALLRLKLCLLSGEEPEARDAVLTIKAYFGGLDTTTEERLERYFHRKRNFYEAVSSTEILKIAPRIKDSRLAESVREAVNAASLTRTLSTAAKRFKGMKEIGRRPEEAIEGSTPLCGILDYILDFRGDTKLFVDTVETAIERAGKRHVVGNENGVALLTFFKAKGLEWRSVIITGSNEGIIPHKRSPIEDERRLFYVAMTRANSNLLISYVKRTSSGALAPSRFLAEAGLIKK
jgi:DNA helicase II / ATP-dependent DNA helicase PcrA